MPIKISNLEDSQKTFILYGDTGTRKTTSLSTIPKEALPGVLFDIDRKSAVLKDDINMEDWTIFQFADFISTGGKRPTDKANLYKDVWGTLEMVYNDMKETQTIIIDSMTLLYSGILQLGRDENGKAESEGISQPEYGVALNRTQKFVMKLKASGKHIILICHEKLFSNEITGLQKGMPALAGQLANIIPRYMLNLIHTTFNKKKDKFVWEIRDTGIFSAAVNNRELPNVIEQDFGLIW